MSGGTNSLKSTSNDIRNFSRQFYLLTEFPPQICWKEDAEEIFSYFYCLTCGLNSGLMSNKPIQYILDYDDFTSRPAAKFKHLKTETFTLSCWSRNSDETVAQIKDFRAMDSRRKENLCYHSYMVTPRVDIGCREFHSKNHEKSLSMVSFLL